MDLWGGFSWGSLPSRPGSPFKSHEERLEAASNAVRKMAVVSPERQAGVGLMSPISTLAGPLGGEISPITPEGDIILPSYPSSASAFWRSRSLLGPGNSPQPRGINQMHAASVPPDLGNALPCPPVNLQNHFSSEPGFTIWNEGGVAKESFPRLHVDTALVVGVSSEGLPEAPQTLSTSTGLEGPTSQCTTVSQDEFDRTFSFGPSSRSPSPQFPLDQPPRSVSPTLHEPSTHGVLDRSVSFAAWGAAAFREGPSETPPPSGQEEEGEGQNPDGVATLLEEASRTAIKPEESEGDGRGRSQEGLSSDDEAGVWNDCADEFVESEEEGLAPRGALAFGGWANRSFDLGEALRMERVQSAEGPAASPSVAQRVEGSEDGGRRCEASRVGGFHRRAPGRDQAFGSWECSTPEFGCGASFGGEERGVGFGQVATVGVAVALLCNEDELLCEEDEEVSERQQEGSNSLRDSCTEIRRRAEGDLWARQAESLLQIGLGSGPLVGLGRKAVSDSGLETRGQTDHMDTTGGAKSGSVGVKRSESDAELDAGDTGGVAQSANVRTPEKSPTKRTKAVGLGMSLDCWLPFKQLVGEAGAIAAALEQGGGLREVGVNMPGEAAGRLAGEREGLQSAGLGIVSEVCAQMGGEKGKIFGGGSDVTSEARGQSVGGSSGMGTSEESPTRMELAADHQMDAVDEYADRGAEVTSPRAERGTKTAVRLSLWGSPPAASPMLPAVAVQGLDESPPAKERKPSIDVPPSPSPKPRVSIIQNNSARAGGPLSPGAKNRQAAGLKKAQGLIGQEGLQGVLPPRKPPRAKQWAVKNGIKSLETRLGEGSLGVIRKRRGFGALQLSAGGEASLPGMFSPRENFSGGLSPREGAVDREALIRSRVRKLTAEEKTARLPLYSPWRGAAGASSPPGGDDVSMRTGDVSDDVSRRHSDPSSSNSSSSFHIRSNARLVRNASNARSNFPASPGMPGGGPPLSPMPEDSEGGSEGSKQSYSGAVVGAFGGGGDMDSPETPQVQTIPEEGEQECPEAPSNRQSRMTRQGSLMETKLLMTTALKRTQSFFLFDKHFEFLKVIGRGSYSTVYQARDRRSGGLCAIKKSKREFKGRDDRERYLHEIESVACLSEHPNVVKYYRGWQQEGHFFIQMELCEGGNLKDWTASQTTPLEEDRIWGWVRQVASGLQYLHSKCVLHLDIKPENIFLDLEGTLKIGDFGLAVLRRQWEWEEGDGAYVAPELLREHEPGPEADMYSFGAMIFEWATGRQLPRSGPERQGQVDLPDRSDALLQLVRSLLSGRPESRPSAEEVLAMGL